MVSNLKEEVGRLQVFTLREIAFPGVVIIWLRLETIKGIQGLVRSDKIAQVHHRCPNVQVVTESKEECNHMRVRLN